MSEEDYIAQIKQKNHTLFDASQIQIGCKELETQLRLAFKAGQIEGMEKALPFQNQDPAPSLFERIFGKSHD